MEHREAVRREQEISPHFLKRALVFISLVALAMIFSSFVSATAQVLLLLFGGVLGGLVLGGAADWLHEKLGLRRGLVLALLVMTLVGLCVLAGVLLAAELNQQVGELTTSLPEAASSLQQQLAQLPWAEQLSDRLSLDMPQGESVRQLSGVFSSVLGALGGFVLIVVVSIYVAAEPKTYFTGLMKLFPKRRRARMREVFLELGTTLRLWFIGQLIAMVAVGLLTGFGLWLLGSPMALALGILAGLLDFVPNFGPLVAAIPALLLSLQDGPQQALYVALLYLAIQFTEGYLITPLVQRRAVEIPPVLLLAGQVILGLLLGVTGLLFAAPLAAGLLVVVKMLYVEDLLGDEVSLPGDKKEEDEEEQATSLPVGDPLPSGAP